uniref:Plastocyanin-like domain-containing protein n=1 Tax=Timema cristinae TaxID=61476 RepID=A0A7R9H1E1_TIMCR|nr:unnamed protein product [Timema cristinae]
MDGDERFTSVHQVAVLRYQGAPRDEDPPEDVGYEEAYREGLTMNALNTGTDDHRSVAIPRLEAIIADDESLKPKADLTYYISYDFYNIDNPHFHRFPYYGYNQAVPEKVSTPQLNFISMKLPPFPLLSQPGDIAPDMMCDSSTAKNCTRDYCECTHVLSVPLGDVVELIIIDKGVRYDANHPFHLHGHGFRVVAMERLNSSITEEEVRSLDKAGLIRRKLSGAPLKDTVTVPDGGYTIVRFHANNPGYWLFHCHIEFHVEIGMALVFKVGEHSDFPPVPRGFPQCNSWLPSEEELDVSDTTTSKTTTSTITYSENDEDNAIPNIISITHWWPLLTQTSARISIASVARSDLISVLGAALFLGAVLR